MKIVRKNALRIYLFKTLKVYIIKFHAEIPLVSHTIYIERIMCLPFCVLQCLLLTAIIYLLVPELNDLHGKSLACHSISLSLGFLLLALSQFHDMLLLEGEPHTL